jgi:hypothetical protein
VLRFGPFDFCNFIFDERSIDLWRIRAGVGFEFASLAVVRDTEYCFIQRGS